MPAYNRERGESAGGGSAADRAYFEVKEQILTGALPGGHLFAEGEVAEPLGISRTPVREALLRLQADGLVTLIPKRGAVVSASSRGEARDVHDLRLALEGAAARRIAADRLDTTALAGTLAESIDEQERLSRDGDLPGMLIADAGFHRAIIRGSGNVLAEAMYGSLADRQRRINLMWLDPGSADVDAVLRDHRRLARLVTRHDADGYERALHAHLGRSLAALGAGAAG
jgi:DNA-binding GntR family transcriptional regulator